MMYDNPYGSLTEDEQMRYYDYVKSIDNSVSFNHAYARGAADAYEEVIKSVSEWGVEPWNRYSPLISFLRGRGADVRDKFDLWGDDEDE